MLTEKELNEQQELIKRRDMMNERIKQMEFRKDNFTLGEMPKLWTEHLDCSNKKVNVAMVTRKEYEKLKNGVREEFNIFDTVPVGSSLKSALQDAIYIVATRVETIEFEHNVRTDEVTLWVIVKDA